MAAQALAAVLPELSSAIRTVRLRVPKNFEVQTGGEGRAFTYDRGRKGLPFVNCPYRETASDLLTVVHEFSHALQIVASGRSTMPPVARELCAFLGERLFLSWLRENQPSLLPLIESAWVSHNSNYFGNDLRSLVSAQECGSEVYDYGWNYPIARLLAQAILQEWTDKKIASLFKSGAKAPSLLADFLDRPSILPQRYVLPALDDTGGTVANLYRQIGGLVMLDLQDTVARVSDEAIGSRYDCLFECMRGRCVFLALDRHQTPLGYVLWQRGQEGEPVHFEHRVACIQRLPDLLTSFENHCPQVAADFRRAEPGRIAVEALP
ncbi:hypothetical protein ACFPOD_13305 [Nitratireductor kimnyeongensis]|uniref:Uncharacterized protein n=1 Tax=Nitratireductor kimnyeongensis TaxID=430679 RepID=A0ABW0TB05_9HYPH|nr:hypothetical protein [Nitratireductor kimnyeongensis]QZZ35519.1 hypothetical protein KW403_17535 [Nitratireductor kimnyeongensis]